MSGMIFMVFSILLDPFIGHMTRTASRIPNAPKMRAPLAFSHWWKRFLNPAGRTPFHESYPITHRQRRRVRYIEVDMIFTDPPWENFNVVRIAHLTTQFAYPQTDCFGQHRVPILGNPDPVNLQVMNRRRTFPIRSHGKPYTKSFGLKSIVFTSKLRQ